MSTSVHILSVNSIHTTSTTSNKRLLMTITDTLRENHILTSVSDVLTFVQYVLS